VRYTRRQRRFRIGVLVAGLALVGAAGAWWYWRGPVRRSAAPVQAGPVATQPSRQPEVVARPSPVREVVLAADEQVLIPASQPSPVPVTQPVADPLPQSGTGAASEPRATPQVGDDPTAARAGDQTQAEHPGIEQARRLLRDGQLIEARNRLNSLLNQELDEAASAEVRSLLTRLADDTLFGRRTVPGDPLVESYTVQPGDVLMQIGRRFDVPYEILMVINGISDPTRIREGQKLKVLRGPFHAKIYKSKFRLDVYLQQLYVRSYKVGLGTDNGTPEGVWKVKNRLENPTFYPPPSATDKRIIPPGDPTNPLGKRWIGLEGVEGPAVGHEGYGIHGTIEPESIGTAVSLGCIRMHNEDVEFLYNLLLPERSTVTVLP